MTRLESPRAGARNAGPQQEAKLFVKNLLVVGIPAGRVGVL